MIKRVIFDQDNTLITFLDDIWYTLDDTFEDLNYQFNNNKKQIIINCVAKYEEIYNQYNKEYMYKYINEELNEKLPIDWIDIWLDKLSNRKLTLEPYTKEILEYLKQKYELVVLTNWFSFSQINILKKANIYNYFDKFIGTDEVLNKPNMEAFIKGIGNHKPEECLMVGDNFNIDIIGAYQAGLEAIWYNPKHKQLNEKIKVIEIDNLEQLKNYL